MLHEIVEAQPVGDHSLLLTFDDGATGTVDIARMVRFDGVFAALQDPVVFAGVRVDPELGTVVWPGGADLCPDVLYARVTGQELPATVHEAKAS
jgi:hypothetical protein